MLYLVIAIICAVILVAMAALGDFDTDADFDTDVDFDVDADADVDIGHFDSGHGDFTGSGISPLSIPILLIFGTGFGAAGTILEALEYEPLVVPIIAGVVSAAVAGIMYVVMVRVFVRTQGSTAVGLQDLVGHEGLLTIRVDEGDPGQVVVVTEKRGRVTAPAVAAESIPTNTQVKVTGVVGDSVKVVRIKPEAKKSQAPSKEV